MSIDFPAEFFTRLPGGPEGTNDPDVRRAVDWFKGFIGESEWAKRRKAVANRLYESALHKNTDERGRFFVESDTFGWYLFLGEACLDHAHNYEPMFGSRVVPLLQSIGRNLDRLKAIPGLEPRVRKLVSKSKSQPNGGFFELLVAAAYLRAGVEVVFVNEEGGGKKHDMDVKLGGRSFAVECKRMETSQYGEDERTRSRKLWQSPCTGLAHLERNTFCDVHFTVELKDVPDDYLDQHVHRWLASSLPSLLWDDEIGYGIVGDLDLEPLRSLLATDSLLFAGTRMLELLAGRYVPFANYIQALRVRKADNPRYVDECDLAVLLRWECVAPASIDAKARDVLKRLSEANAQLPVGRPGIVHIGWEAVEGHAVERARYEKILDSTTRFDPRGKQLEYVYCHYLVPESPPNESWAFEETTQWIGIRPTGPRPLKKFSLVIPDEAVSRQGVHWQSRAP